MKLSKDEKLIIKTIKENPQCVIYYDDNCSWLIYKNTRDLKKSQIDGKSREILVGDHSSSEGGYAPDLIVVLAHLLKIKVDSV